MALTAVPDLAPARLEDARAHSVKRALLQETVLITCLFLVYNGGRMLGAQHVSGAFTSALDVWRAERWLHLPSEQAVQAAVLGVPAVVRAANGYYAFVHFPLTFGVLAWLFLRRPAHYLWARRALVTASATALVVYMTVPVAPPRMLDALGFVDTGLRYGTSVYGRPGAASLSNQYAAMPSLHVGWSVLVAVVLVAACRTRWRWLWLLHPVATVLVVAVTANHFWLDGVAGAAIVALALVIMKPRSERAARHAEREAVDA